MDRLVKRLVRFGIAVCLWLIAEVVSGFLNLEGIIPTILLIAIIGIVVWFIFPLLQRIFPILRFGKSKQKKMPKMKNYQ